MAGSTELRAGASCTDGRHPRWLSVRGLDMGPATQLNERHHEQERPELDRELLLGIADDVLRDLYVRGKYRRDPVHDRAAPGPCWRTARRRSST